MQQRRAQCPDFQLLRVCVCKSVSGASACLCVSSGWKNRVGRVCGLCGARTGKHVCAEQTSRVLSIHLSRPSGVCRGVQEWPAGALRPTSGSLAFRAETPWDPLTRSSRAALALPNAQFPLLLEVDSGMLQLIVCTVSLPPPPSRPSSGSPSAAAHHVRRECDPGREDGSLNK